MDDLHNPAFLAGLRPVAARTIDAGNRLGGHRRRRYCAPPSRTSAFAFRAVNSFFSSA
jgi:hypothetical protein